MLVIRGDRTIPYYRVVVEALCAALPSRTASVVVPGAGHLGCLLDPTPFAALVARFVRKHGGSRQPLSGSEH